MRMKRQLVVFAVSAAAIGIIPFAVLMWHTYYQTRLNAEARLRHVTQLAAEHSADVLNIAQNRLAELAAQTDGQCDQATLEALLRVPYENQLFRQATMFRDGWMICTSWGRLQKPFEVSPGYAEVPPPGKILIAKEHVARTRRTDSVVVNYRANDHTLLNVIISPTEFIPPLRDLSNVSGFSMVVADARQTTMLQIGDTIMVPLSASGVYRHNNQTTLVSTEKTRGITAALRVDDSWILADWRSQASFIVPLGLLVTACFVFMVVRLSRRNMSLPHQLLVALRRRQFLVHYQPTVSLGTGRCVGAEALIRWQHPDAGLLRPDHFVAIAEDSGMIVPMTDWLMQQVADEIGEIMRTDPDFHVAINLCGAHFLDADFVARASRIFSQAGIPMSAVYFEMTERGLVDAADNGTRAAVRELRQTGAKLGLDDFGTGYSSLAYLANFEIDFLKIDKSFVNALGRDAVTSDLAEVIVQMARTLNLNVIAEGVETAKQEAVLAGLQIDLVQGWRYSRAIPANAYIAFRRHYNTAETHRTGH